MNGSGTIYLDCRVVRFLARLRGRFARLRVSGFAEKSNNSPSISFSQTKERGGTSRKNPDNRPFCQRWHIIEHLKEDNARYQKITSAPTVNPRR